MKVYDNFNSISYIYDKFKPGSLTSDYIPLILSLAGDKTDNISGIPGIGNKKAIDCILNCNLQPELFSNYELPFDLMKYKSLIENNYRLISFDEQIKRIPDLTIAQLNSNFKH
jgi:5'-3' exonuclease